MATSWLRSATILAAWLGLAFALQKCYEDIGCFDNGSPFYDPPNRPVSWLPESRDEVGTQFRLNTRENSNMKNWEELSTYDVSTLSGSTFKGYRDTKIILHGFTQGANVDWMEEMATAFLTVGDYNVIRVDWRDGALDLYGISTANTRIVGAEISLLIDLLKVEFGVDASSFHIIGHSLGAHASGYAGERQTDPQVARITGLDPAGPYFEGTDTIVRLDPTDATFVDIIHSDTDPVYTLGYGMYAACGHMDFYPNEGRAQPGCDQSFFEFVGSEGGLWDGTTQFVACNHLRAIEYFIESIYASATCEFVATKCGYGESNEYGLCFGDRNTARMGFYSVQDRADGNTYQITTRSSSDFCGQQYLFSIKTDDPRRAEEACGQIYVQLFGYSGQSSRFALTSETEEYSPDTIYMHVGASDVHVGLLSGLYLDWDYDVAWYEFWDWELWERPRLYITQIQITDFYGTTTYMCGGDDGIPPDEATAFYAQDSPC
ncbi:pancreatic triacylglycerol lipase-like [Diadema antillarum]|uniref:pancreatic triacylglycerol lipase-like n=1 Tax=Diadema antillarum TaxID=105358 RepID=UPI003A841C88